MTTAATLYFLLDHKSNDARSKTISSQKNIIKEEPVYLLLDILVTFGMYSSKKKWIAKLLKHKGLKPKAHSVWCSVLLPVDSVFEWVHYATEERERKLEEKKMALIKVQSLISDYKTIYLGMGFVKFVALVCQELL